MRYKRSVKLNSPAHQATRATLGGYLQPAQRGRRGLTENCTRTVLYGGMTGFPAVARLDFASSSVEGGTPWRGLNLPNSARSPAGRGLGRSQRLCRSQPPTPTGALLYLGTYVQPRKSYKIWLLTRSTSEAVDLLSRKTKFEFARLLRP